MRVVIGGRKYVFAAVILLSTCVLLIFASEHSDSTVFGTNFKDTCLGGECLLDDAGSSSTAGASQNISPIHVVITFTNAEYKRELQKKFSVTVSSLFQYSTLPLTLYIIGDSASQLIARKILAEHVTQPDKYTVRRIFYYHWMFSCVIRVTG